MAPHHPPVGGGSSDSTKVGLVGALIAALLAALGSAAFLIGPGQQTTAPSSQTRPVSTEPQPAQTAPQTTQPSIDLPLPGPGITDKSTRPKPPPRDPG